MDSPSLGTYLAEHWPMLASIAVALGGLLNKVTQLTKEVDKVTALTTDVIYLKNKVETLSEALISSRIRDERILAKIDEILVQHTLILTELSSHRVELTHLHTSVQEIRHDTRKLT